MISQYESAYQNLVNEVVTFGEHRQSRAGPTRQVFGATLSIDCLPQGQFPLLTGRKMYPTPVFGELAAFLVGATDLQTFRDLGCNYWDTNAEAWGSNDGLEPTYWKVGQIYGAQWRSWRGEGYDQLAVLINELTENPFSRRHLLTTYDPEEQNACLPPCHLLAQFNVTNDGALDCCVYMRSVDLCLGLPSDVVLYSGLLLLISKEVGLNPGRLLFVFGDAHIYENHVSTWSKQVKAEKHTLPLYKLIPGAKLWDFKPTDIQIIGYEHSGKLEYQFNV